MYLRRSHTSSVLLTTALTGCALFSGGTDPSPPGRTNPALYSGTTRGASHLAPAGAAVDTSIGFASITGELRGRCIEAVETKPSGSNVDEIEVTYAEDASTLSKVLDVSMSAGAEFGLVNVSAEAKYVTESASSRSASFLVVRSVSLAPVDALVRYRLTNDALAALRQSPQHFYRRCGDQFVASVQRGATFSAIAKIESASSSDRQQLRDHAKASYLGFDGGGGVDTEIASTMDRLRVQFHVIQSGRQEEIPTFHQFVTKARQLNDDLAAHPGSGHVVRFETKPYDVTENWPADIALPALNEQARTLETLAQWHRKFGMSLAELEEARLAPKKPPCERGPALFQRAIGNFTMARRRVEERAHACVERPMNDCTTQGLAPPSATPPPVIAQCSNVAAHRAAAQEAERRNVAAEQQRARVEERRVEQTRRAAQTCRGSIEESCDPCRFWEFGTLRFDAPRTKANGDTWDAGGGPPDPVVRISSGNTSRDARSRDSFRVSRRFEPPLRLRAGQSVSAHVMDQDLSAHDTMMNLSDRVPDRLHDGVWSLGTGALQLSGRCAE